MGTIITESSIFAMKYKARRVRNNHGFTLVELLVVTTLLAVLSAIALSEFSFLKLRARTTRTVSEIRGIEKEIIAYALEKGNLPDSFADIGSAFISDPWGNAYVYVRLDVPLPSAAPRTYVDPLNTDFDLYSKGPNGTSTDPSIAIPAQNGYDDIVRGNNGSFVGSAEKYGL